MNLTRWAELFNQTGKSILIENCHWGGTTPTADWCPWNYFRSSGDIRADYGSIVSNLQTTIEWAMSNLSRPGCWAYPDMLEVGVGSLTFQEWRSHFGAWCIVSSPLILSHDMTDPKVTATIWPIISNTEAIDVNQAWSGFSGSVFAQANNSITLGKALDAVPVWQYWYKPISATQTAVLLMNHDASTASLTVNFSTIPGVTCTTCKLRDVWAHADLGSFTGTYTASNLITHDSAFVIVSA